MKHLINKPLKALWRMTAPIRRPVRARIDRFLHSSIVVPVVQGTAGPDRISNLELHAQAVTQRVELIQHDLNLTLNDLVREVTRLQIQIEAVREHLEEMHPAGPDVYEPERRLAG